MYRFLFIILVFLSSSCRERHGLFLLHSFPENYWNRFDKQTFDFMITDSNESWNLELIIRHNDTYPFDNLYINVVIYLPGGEERIMEHDFEMIGSDRRFLSEQKNGYREIKFPLNQDLGIHDEGLCRVEIENLIPKIGIPGMVGLGVRMTKSAR
jgi:gliding motility-associated lipoprotein GldH